MALERSSKIFTHLWYAREAEEAARFYASVFPDSRVDRVTPLLSDTPSGPAGSVKVVDFTLFGQRFQAISAGPHHEFNDAISIVVQCDDQAEPDRYWDALLEGGRRFPRCGPASPPGGAGSPDFSVRARLSGCRPARRSGGHPGPGGRRTR